MPGIDNNNPRQPFEQIADYYTAEIEAKRLGPGDRLPPVRDIATEFNVAIGTANNAIKMLKDAGLIMSWQGRGVFVRDGLASSLDPATADPDAAYRAIMTRLDEMQDEVDVLSSRVAQLEQTRPQQAS